MAKKAAARKVSTRTARTAPAAEGAKLDTSAGTDANTDKTADAKAKEASQRVERPHAQAQPEPFHQPAMIPATPVHAATMGYVDVEDQEAASRKPRKGIRVQAKALGYYDDVMRRVGDVFTIDAAEDKNGKIVAFSDKWMRRVPATTPERLTVPNQAIAREHDVTQAERHGLELPPDTPPNTEVEI